MSRFKIQWSYAEQRWLVLDTQSDLYAVADFDSLLEAETYVIERETRAEQ